MKRAWLWLSKPYDASSGYVASADLLRVFSVFLVAWYHVWQQSWLRPEFHLGPLRLNLEPYIRVGYMGVDLLIALSGFLLFLPYARARLEGFAPPRLKTYYLRRAARILPSYYACILIVLFFFALPRNEYASTRDMWCDLLPHLTFTHNLFPYAYQFTHLNGVLWTMAVEVQFYLVAPFVGRAFIKKPFLTYALMAAAGLAYRRFYVLPMEDYTLFFNRLPAMLDVYANGMMGAYLYVWLCKKMKKTGWKALLMSVAALACAWGALCLLVAQSRQYGDMRLIHTGQMLRRFPLSALGALALALGGHGLAFLTRAVRCAPIRWLSSISYNVYIWHAYLAIQLKAWHIPPYAAELPNQAGEQPWQLHYTLLCLGGAVAFGALMTYLIEKPLARLIAPRRGPARL